MLLLICLSFSICRLYPQESTPVTFNTKVLYSVFFALDSTDLSNTIEEDCYLFINNDMSLFESTKSYSSNEPETQVIFKRAKNQFKYLTWSIVKDDKDNMITHDWYLGSIGEDINKYYNYPETATDFDWVLHSDTARIGGLLCQKATLNFGKRKWVAWFTPEIPIDDGPYKFKGLPGLIIKINDDKNHWNFEVKQIKNSPQGFIVNTDFHQSEKIRNKALFFKQKKYLNENYLQIKEGAGNFRLDTENRALFQSRLNEKNKKENNWIEPYP